MDDRLVSTCSLFTIWMTRWSVHLYLLYVQQMDDWLVCICRLFKRWMTGWSVHFYLPSVQQMDDWIICICHHFETLGQFRYSTSSFYHNCFCTWHISLCIFVSNQTSSQTSSWYHRSSPNTTYQPAPRCLLFNRCPCVRIK